MVDHVGVMIAAVVLSVLLMMVFAGGIGRIVSDHPTIKMLAFAFLLVIGVVLIADGFDHQFPKGYVYFAMAFSVIVELLNIRMQEALGSTGRVARALHTRWQISPYSYSSDLNAFQREAGNEREYGLIEAPDLACELA